MEKEEYLVSVILPIYNVEKYLNKCIETVVNQTYRNLDIILVDDEAKDSSPAICEKWKAKDERINVIHKKNGGLGLARNTGLEHAQGDFVVFVDSDDFLETNAIEKLLENREDADTVLCGHNVYYGKNNIEEKHIKYAGEKFVSEKVRDILVEMMGSLPEENDDIALPVSVWHGLYSMDIIKKNNIKFPSERVFISEDMVFDTDYFRHSKKVKFINDCLYYYRKDNENSLTSVYNPERFKKEIDLYLELDRKLSEIYSKDEYLFRLQRTFLGRTRSCIVRAVKQTQKPLKEIYKICSNFMVQQVLMEYPYKRNKKSLYAFNFCIKYRKIRLLYIMVKLKNRK